MMTTLPYLTLPIDGCVEHSAAVFFSSFRLARGRSRGGRGNFIHTVCNKLL